MTINIFDQNDKLDCTIVNSRFIFVTTSLWQSIANCLYLIKHKEVTSAAELFSDTFQQFFPKEPSNLDHLKESNVFYGELQEHFSVIYFDLLELWKDLQEERVANMTGENININPVGLEKILTKAKGELELIVKKFCE